MTACKWNGNTEPKKVENSKSEEIIIDADTIITPDSTSYGTLTHHDSCYIVISKPALRLYVHERQNGTDVLLADYPVCVAKNYGQKHKKGDMLTPECTAANPFIITEIVSSTKWTHDFGDGRGEILAYGDWFMRLKTPGHKGIGIHGSTNNENSVPGRGSESCIRMRNNELNLLKENYAFVGMKVIIEADTIRQEVASTATSQTTDEPLSTPAL